MNKYEVRENWGFKHEFSDEYIKLGYVIVEITPSGRHWTVYSSKYWLPCFVKAHYLTRTQPQGVIQ